MTQACRIAADDPWYLRLDKADQLDVLLFRFGAENAQAVFDQRIEIELHIVQFDLPGLELGDVQNLVDQCQQFIPGAVDGLYVVALLDRKWCAQQQFGHAKDTIHRGADFMADLGQKLGLGIDFGVAGGQVSADAEAVFGDAALAFAKGNAHQQTADANKCHECRDQALRLHQGQSQQGGQDNQCAEIEHHHGSHEQARRTIAFLPVPGAHEQHAETGEGDHCVGNDIQRQCIDE